MGNGSRLITAANGLRITVNGVQVQYLHGTYTYAVTGINGDFMYPLMMDEVTPTAFYSSFYSYLRILYKLKIGKKEEIQLIINNSNELVPKLWRTYMQNLLFNKKEKQFYKRERQEKPKTYNPLDKYRSSMKGKFR